MRKNVYFLHLKEEHLSFELISGLIEQSSFICKHNNDCILKFKIYKVKNEHIEYEAWLKGAYAIRQSNRLLIVDVKLKSNNWTSDTIL